MQVKRFARPKRGFGAERPHSCSSRTWCFILAFLALFAQTAAQASWVHASRRGDTAYFLFDAPPRLERFAIADEQWLPSLSFSAAHGSATAFAADTESLFVAFGKAVKRYDLNGGNEIHITEVENTVRDILIDGELVILNHSVSMYAYLTSVSKTNNTVIAQYTKFMDSLIGTSIAPSVRKIFGRRLGSSPFDITFATYDADGTFQGGGKSPYHGWYPSANRTWVFPDETKVVDNSGTVYSTENLVYLNSLGGSFDAIDFFGSTMPIVLRGSLLESYSAALLPEASYALAFTPKTMYVAGANVWTFTPDAGQPGGVRADCIPIARLTPPTPGAPVDPDGLSYTPDTMFVTTHGVLLLYSESHQSLFRWDVETQSYLSTIPLLGSPSWVTYSPVNHKVYLAYENGLIRQLDLNAEDPQEVPFAILAARPLGLAAADAYVFAVDASGSLRTHYTFAPTGERISNDARSDYSRGYAWSTVRQKMYHFREGTTPITLLSREINADGVTYDHLPPGGLGERMRCWCNTGFQFFLPIRVAPDGSVVLLGSGFIHDPVTLERLPTALANAFTDAAWVKGQLRTIRTVNDQAQVQHWMEPDYTAGDAIELPGSAHGLLPVAFNRLVAVTLVDGVPTFTVLDEKSRVLGPPKPLLIENLHGGGWTLLGWSGTFWVQNGQTFSLDESHTLQRASFNIQLHEGDPNRITATLWDWDLAQVITEVAGMTDSSELPGWKQFDFPDVVLPPGKYAITVSIDPSGPPAWASYGFAVNPGDVIPGDRVAYGDPSTGWRKHVAYDSQCRFELMPFVFFELIIDANPPNVGQATPLPYGAHEILYGTVVTNCVPDVVVGDPGVRYVQTGWTGAGSVPASGSNACVEFTLETYSALTWHWQRQFTLTLVQEQGSLHGTAQGFHNEGTLIQIIPEAPFGYAFSHWLVNGAPAGSAEPLDTVLDEPKTIEAVFVRVLFELIIDATPPNVGQATPLPYGAHSILSGTVVTSCVPDVVVGDPGVRYVQTGWTGTGSVPASGTDACVDFTLETDSSLTWHWQRQFSLNLLHEQGSLHGTAQGFHNEGTRIQIIPEAPFGYAFSHWLVNGALAGSVEPLDTVLDEPKTIEAVFVRIFLDITEEVTVSFSDWNVNRQTGTYFITLELCLKSDSQKVLIEPFWFVLEETPNWRLMHPDGIEPNSGHHYVDITQAVLAQLPFIGNGDNALDPGECVTIEGIEIYSKDRTIPNGMVFAVWADPPPVVVFDPPSEPLPMIVGLRPGEDGKLALHWIANSAGTYHLEARGAPRGEWQALQSNAVDGAGTHVFHIESNGAGMMLFRVRKGQ